MYNFIRAVSLLVMVLQATVLFSQTTKQIQLLDQDTNFPISGAYFEYGSQSGVSDEAGIVSLSIEKDSVLTISHIAYGTWTLSGKSLESALSSGRYYGKSEEVNLYPVTVIAVKSGQSPTDKISLQHWDHMAHDGASVLNQSPVFNSIRKSGSYGFDPVLRGFKYDQLNVVMNGAQSATAACPNRMDPPTSQMAPNMMDRIEVLKGPFALRYGAGFGGTINFIQSALRFSEQPTIYGRASLGYESNGNTFRNEGQLGLSGKAYDLSLFGAWSQGDDYTAGNDATVQSDFNRGSYGVNLGLKLAQNQQLRLSTLYNRTRDADFAALPMDLRNDDTWMFNIRHDMVIHKGALESWNTTAFASIVDHRMDNLLKQLDPRMMNATTDAKTHNYGGRTEGYWRFAKGSLYAGADLRVEGAEGTRTQELLMGPMAGLTFHDNVWQDGQISKTGLFAEYHVHSNGYHFVVSGRTEVNNAAINDPSTEFAQVYAETVVSQINPSFSLGVSKWIGEKAKTGLWLGRVQRSASLTERFINFFPVGQDPYELIGNPNLNPEINNQLDLTYEWSSEKTAINVDVFAAYLQDAISSRIDPTLSPRLSMSPGVRQYLNIDQAFKTGVEVNWSQQLVAGLQQQVAMTYTYAQDLELDQPLPEIPPLDFRYSLVGDYLGGKLQPSASFRHVLSQERISAEYGETATPAFSLVDLNVGYQVVKPVRLTAGVNNLLDETYYEHLNRSVSGTTNPIYARGRNYFFSLNVRF